MQLPELRRELQFVARVETRSEEVDHVPRSARLPRLLHEGDLPSPHALEAKRQRETRKPTTANEHPHPSITSSCSAVADPAAIESLGFQARRLRTARMRSSIRNGLSNMRAPSLSAWARVLLS